VLKADACAAPPEPAGLWLRLQGSHFHTSPELFLQPSGGTQFHFPSGKFILRAGRACLLQPAAT